MRPIVRTRGQARQRLGVALRALDDVVRSAPRKNGRGEPVVPNGAVFHSARAHSHVRAAIQSFNGNNRNNRNHSADAGK